MYLQNQINHGKRKHINKKNYNSKLEVDILKKLISRKSVSAYITQPWGKRKRSRH